jgi:hypothetical protein
MCDVLLPPGVNPITVKYIYHIIKTKSTVRIRPYETSRTGSPQTYRILKLFVGFRYRTIFCSADRRQYSGSLLRDLGITALIIMGQGEYRFTRKPPICYLYQQMCVCISSKLKNPAPVLRSFYTTLRRSLLDNF